MPEYLKIYLENDIEEKKLEKLKKLQIKFPLYMNRYRKALTTILQYIDFNQEKDRQNSDRKYYDERQGFSDRKYKFGLYQGYDYIQYPDNSNIIAFIGKRGSGKTTALREFCSILHNYSNTFEHWKEELPYESSYSNKYSFHVLPPIDASVLDEEEDLLELVWAEMYQIFRNKVENVRGLQNEEDIKRIIREFDEVYQNYHNINHENRTEILGESVLVKLKNISSSQKARETFGKLVSDFLDIMEENKDSYLVITLDDIDVNLNKGYEMLEQIHKYLCNFKVIVLIAIDFDQMSMICEKRFANSLTIHYTDQKLEKDRREIIKKACNDYLLKILPLENRIYQPNEETMTKEALVCRISWNDDNEKIKDALIKTKEYILWKIAQKTSIYYDSQGIKKHFCIPSTVRELITYDKLLDSMFELEDCSGVYSREVISNDKMELFKRNNQWFHQDIVERMAIELLSYEQLKLFHLILSRHIEKRAEYAVLFIRNWIKNGRRIPEGRLVDNIESINYNYTDLLEQIYRLGRDNYIDDILVYCILAALTTEMTREYYIYRHSDDDSLKKEACIKLLNFRGTTFGGKWFQNMSNYSLKNPIEYIEKLDSTHIEIKHQFDLMESNYLYELGKFVQCMECLSVCFSRFKYKTGENAKSKWNCIFKVDPTEKNIMLEIIIESSARSVDFDMFGFIGKELEESDDFRHKNSVIDSFKDGIEKIEKNVYLHNDKITEKFKTELIQVIEESSIWNIESGFNKNDISFPFYNLDLSYNVMKRVRREIKDSLVLYDQGFFSYFQRIYELVIEKLEAQDKFYRNTKFAEKFKSNPVVYAFIENELDATIFNDTFKQMLNSVFIPSVKDLEIEE